MASISTCAIHPAIGIARVGNSPTDWFYGPESPGEIPGTEEGFTFKDDCGRIKRQAARFRIYATYDDGTVRELNHDDPGIEIEWTVHVANTKAAWYESLNAMDLPELGMTAQRRNKKVLGADRLGLEINPGPRSICGAEQAAVPLIGNFVDTEVQLGEIQTDSAGRLVFLGGFGHSVTPSSSNPITNFSNNDGWHDDVSDGPVTAQVTVDGVTMEAEAAWVAVAPPNYAPGITPVVTLYELCLDAVGTKLYPDRPSFADDIYPLLQRLSAMQWVNSGQDFYHGWKANLDLLDEEFLSTLADTSPGGAKAQFFDELRNPDFLVDEPDKIPVLMGDGIDYPGSPRRWFAFLAQQYEAMRRWKDGEFDNDTGLYPPLPVPLEQIPPDEQPAALDRAAIEPCLGGPFHPGIELTWPLRQASMWRAPLRLNHRDVQGRTGLTEDYGLLLSPEKCLDPVDGPLTESGPGDLTRWMGCPWQSDAASCQNIYVPKDFPLPAWWPAILPIDVLPDFGYQQIMAADLLQQQRQKFFGFRRGWSRGIGDVGYHAAGGYAEAMIHMVNDWHKLGFVVAQPAPDDPEAPDVPNPLYVETERQEFEA